MIVKVVKITANPLACSFFFFFFFFSCLNLSPGSINSAERYSATVELRLARYISYVNDMSVHILLVGWLVVLGLTAL